VQPHPTSDLPVAWYFPPEAGRYEVAPGLSRFGRDFGNGAPDAQVFQIDSNFPEYRAAKLAARRQRLGKYHCTHQFSDEVAAAAANFLVHRLPTDHPSFFQLDRELRGGARLSCGLTGEVLDFNADMVLANPVPAHAPDPPYVSSLDALACQVPEDLAVVSTDSDHHWLSAAHVCFPNGWAPEEKVGRGFSAIHEPVAGMEEMNRRGGEFARLMRGATDGLVRFAWGVTFDDRLDHHPTAERSTFDPRNPAAFLRVERQTVWGLSAASASLFTIRTYMYPCAALPLHARVALVRAVRSMSNASLAYKGLDTCQNAVVEWLLRTDAG
jgi:hypothetical protein